MQLFGTVVHNDKANILNSISTTYTQNHLTSELDPYSNFALSCQSTDTGFRMFHY